MNHTSYATDLQAFIITFDIKKYLLECTCSEARKTEAALFVIYICHIHASD